MLLFADGVAQGYENEVNRQSLQVASGIRRTLDLSTVGQVHLLNLPR